MYFKPTLESEKELSSPSVKLTKFDRWWGNFLPERVRNIMPHWIISAIIVSGVSVASTSEIIITMTALFWASIAFAFGFRKIKNLSPFIEKQKWIIPLYHALLFALVAQPVIAQEVGTVAACNTQGLFGAVGTFVTNLFAAVTFGAIGGATLSNLICQVVGFLTLAIMLGFLAVLGYVSFQIGYQRQPVSTTLDPIFGFLIFAGGASIVIGVMIGTGEITS